MSSAMRVVIPILGVLLWGCSSRVTTEQVTDSTGNNRLARIDRKRGSVTDILEGRRSFDFDSLVWRTNAGGAHFLAFWSFWHTLPNAAPFMKFKVEATLSIEGTACVMARPIEKGEFSVTSSSRLGGVSVQEFLEIPRKVKEGRALLLDVFVFALAESADLSLFQKHQIVELIP
jgi:hypothetical protein